MLKALVTKELRESAGIIAIGALAVVYALADLTGVQLFPWQNAQPYAFPFLDERVLTYVAAIGGALAVGLGFKQSAWELWHSSYYFLLHRPASRTRIFGTKLAVGIGAGWVLTAAIVLLFGAWAATPGNSAAPFFWSMTGTAWRIWFALPVLYLGAFLSGIRPGRWFGSRLIPLVTAGAVVAVSVMVPWWWLGAGIAAAAGAVFLASICEIVGSRDY